MTDTSRIGTVAEAAAERGVSKSTMREWARTGKVQAERVGQRRYAINLDTLHPDPRRDGALRALQVITPDDARAMADLASRLNSALGDSKLQFWQAWDLLGIAALGAAGERRAA
jgi:excisionase family DNA binding protein